jgi:hypothetical protein
MPARSDSAASDDLIPRIIVRTHPAELMVTTGLFRPIRGTKLKYAADTDSQLFVLGGDAFVLLSGRWYKSQSLRGPWTHVPPHDLPDEFAKIPPGTPQAAVLASVPGTSQAELAVLANSVPTTATVNRHTATLEVTYDGEPKFNPIAETQLSYAVNAQLPVVKASSAYFALQDGVWFTATNPKGPWEVAAEVPEEIYTIPPDSPVYYATFARVQDSGDDEVEVSYTPGYQGSYEDDGTVVYGTGCEYEPWYGDDYYGWGWSWGYSYLYVPWYQWWIWRNWWDHPNALRSSVMENVYDRWRTGNSVTPHDRPARAGASRTPSTSYSGFPALYGRFKGNAGGAAASPPANTLALNPYSRPSNVSRPGQTPSGAQLLSAVRQAPGGGRDLYASPDGSVYMRKNNGWYRREAGAGASDRWNFVAPAQGSKAAERAASARAGQSPGAGAAQRARSAPNAANAPGVRGDRLDNRVPDVGSRVRDQDIAALEREYYARSLSQMRQQNWRGSFGGRGGGRRR